MSHKYLLGNFDKRPLIIQLITMDRLFNILQEAQSVVNSDTPAFPMNNNMNFANFQMSYDKPTAHKASKDSAKSKRSWKKPKDKPKRPLSAYNLFFQHERSQILASLPEGDAPIDDGLTEEQRRRKHRKTHGKIGFADLARSIAEKWKNVDPTLKSGFEARAEVEKQRYRKELAIWKSSQDCFDDSSTDESVTAEKPAMPFLQPLSRPDNLISMIQSTPMQVMSTPGMSQMDAMNKRSSTSSIHEYLMAQCRENLLRQTTQQMAISCMPPRNNMCMPNVSINNFMNCGLEEAVPEETFSKDTFFEDSDVESATTDEFLSESEDETVQSPLADELNTFLDEFDCEILFT